mgnify:CR=1 FL=1
MSGRKGMKQYPERIKEEVRRRVAAGDSQREISRETGISRYTIQNWNKTIEDYEKENKRLRMEVALMRDFLQSTERK